MVDREAKDRGLRSTLQLHGIQQQPIRPSPPSTGPHVCLLYRVEAVSRSLPIFAAGGRQSYNTHCTLDFPFVLFFFQFYVAHVPVID